MTTHKDFTKITAIGRNDETGTTWCKIKFEGGKLSITGVEGPLRNGDARGGCGQIDMHEWSFTSYREGWTPELVAKFREVWGQWHHNDMRPYSQAMKAAGWDKLAEREVLLWKYTLTTEAHKMKRQAEANALASLRKGAPHTPSAEDVHFATLPYEITLFSDKADCEPSAPEHYERSRDILSRDILSRDNRLKAPERKTLGWLRQTEHPDGLLGRKLLEDEPGYGCQWWKQDVPQEVLDFLLGLPTPTDKPAWV